MIARVLASLSVASGIIAIFFSVLVSLDAPTWACWPESGIPQIHYHGITVVDARAPFDGNRDHADL